MKIGHKITAKITGYDSRGRGLAEVEIAENAVRDCVIPFTAIGDEVEATFIRRDHGYKVCRLEKIVNPSSSRVDAPCPHAGSCGGCIWQHLDYDAQLKEKMRGMRDLFCKINIDDKLGQIIPSDEIFAYRNRMDFAVGWNGEIGLKEYGQWNRYVDLSTCLLIQPGAGQILALIRQWMSENDLQPWDVKYHSGDIRYVVFRDGVNSNQRMVIVVVADASRINSNIKEDLANKIRDMENKTNGIKKNHQFIDW